MGSTARATAALLFALTDRSKFYPSVAVLMKLLIFFLKRTGKLTFTEDNGGGEGEGAECPEEKQTATSNIGIPCTKWKLNASYRIESSFSKTGGKPAWSERYGSNELSYRPQQMTNRMKYVVDPILPQLLWSVGWTAVGRLELMTTLIS